MVRAEVFLPNVDALFDLPLPGSRADDVITAVARNLSIDECGIRYGCARISEGRRIGQAVGFRSKFGASNSL